MRTVQLIIDNINNSYKNPALNTSVIWSILLMSLLIGMYEFMVYRLVSHRAFYNRSFNICIAVLPMFISTIILCLQSNVVITLGTIGALAILRFRTAVKDPVDMLYLLWAVHIGITCGCQLYEIAVLTSIVVTILLFCMEHLSFGKRPLVIVLHCAPEKETEVLEIIKKHAPKYRVKSRNYTGRGLDMVIEVSVKKLEEFLGNIREGNVERFSVIEYDGDDVL